MLGEVYKGDTWELEHQIVDADNKVIDITNWQIRCEINSKDIKIKKGNNQVNGGSEQQIKILDTNGNIKIIIEKEDTIKCEKGIYNVEVEITSPTGKRFTVIRDVLEVKQDMINWEDLT